MCYLKHDEPVLGVDGALLELLLQRVLGPVEQEAGRVADEPDQGDDEGQAGRPLRPAASVPPDGRRDTWPNGQARLPRRESR